MPDENPSGLGAFDLPLRFPGQRYDAETGLHYNYYRDYDPRIGRYEESDPIGLKGGINIYAYVSSTPLGWTDPLGLVKWKGTVLTGGIGYGRVAGSVETYSLVSECKCGFLYILRVRATTGFSGVGGGLPFSYTGSSVEFEDPADCPNPDVFNGSYGKYSAGIAAILGYSYSIVSLGRAKSVGGAAQMGVELQAGFNLFGKSEVMSQTKACCK